MLAAFTILSLGISTAALQHASAATGSIYLSSTSSTVLVGNTIDVNLRVNPGTNVDTVDASVSYDATKLQFVSADCSGSPFTTPYPSCPTSGNPVHFTSLLLGGGTVSTDSFVGKITFKALASSGSTALNVSGDTAYQGNAIGAGTAGTTLNFTAPAATCPSGQTGTPPNCVTPPVSTGGGTSTGGTSSGGTKTTTPTTTTTPTKTTTPTTTTPTATTPPATGPAAVQVTDKTVQYNTASITVTSSAPTQVYVIYGLDQDSMNSQTAPDGFTTSHKVPLDPSLLTPGKEYYYAVVSKDQSGNTSQTQVASFKTQGLQLSVGVFDKNDKPIANKQVTLHSTAATATTNSKGVAVFSDVEPGSHHVTYASGKKSYSQSLSVANNVVTAADGTQTSAIQNVSVVLPITQTSGIPAALWPAIAVLVVLAVVMIVYVKRDSFRPGSGVHGGGLLVSQPVVVGGGMGKGDRAVSGATINPIAATSSQTVSSRLDNIPKPTSMSPGSTVAPGTTDGGRL